MGELFYCDRCTATVERRDQLHDAQNWNWNHYAVCNECYQAYKDTLDPYFEFAKVKRDLRVA